MTGGKVPEIGKKAASTCAQCTAPLRPDSRFCPSCGAARDGSGPPLIFEEDHPSGTKPWVLAGAAIVLAVLAMAAVLVLRSGDDLPSDSTSAAPGPTSDDPSRDVAEPVPAPELRLAGDGINPFTFGAAFADVDRELRSQLGPPDDDHRGPDDSLCPARTLRWAALRVNFANGGGSRPLTLSGWGYNQRGDAEGSVGPEVFTESGLTLGSGREDLEATLPPGTAPGEDFYFLPNDLQVGLSGFGPDAVVNYLGAGFNGCVE